jgi:hypothetical protein
MIVNSTKRLFLFDIIDGCFFGYILNSRLRDKSIMKSEVDDFNRPFNFLRTLIELAFFWKQIAHKYRTRTCSSRIKARFGQLVHLLGMILGEEPSDRIANLEIVSTFWPASDRRRRWSLESDPCVHRWTDSLHSILFKLLRSLFPDSISQLKDLTHWKISSHGWFSAHSQINNLMIIDTFPGWESGAGLTGHVTPNQTKPAAGE